MKTTKLCLYVLVVVLMIGLIKAYLLPSMSKAVLNNTDIIEQQVNSENIVAVDPSDYFTMPLNLYTAGQVDSTVIDVTFDPPVEYSGSYQIIVNVEGENSIHFQPIFKDTNGYIVTMGVGLPSLIASLTVHYGLKNVHSNLRNNDFYKMHLWNYKTDSPVSNMFLLHIKR